MWPNTHTVKPITFLSVTDNIDNTAELITLDVFTNVLLSHQCRCFIGNKLQK